MMCDDSDDEIEYDVWCVVMKRMVFHDVQWCLMMYDDVCWWCLMHMTNWRGIRTFVMCDDGLCLKLTTYYDEWWMLMFYDIWWTWLCMTMYHDIDDGIGDDVCWCVIKSMRWLCMTKMDAEMYDYVWRCMTTLIYIDVWWNWWTLCYNMKLFMYDDACWR